MFGNLARSMSGAFESAIFVSNAQRRRILQSLFEAYYADLSDRTIFDTNRNWCAMLPGLAELFPAARVICTVRNPAWVIDSVERHIQRSALQPSRMFNHDAFGNVYGRVELLVKGFVGASLNNLRQAWFSEEAGRLIAIRYDSLVERPAEVLSQLYSMLGEEPFNHDFNRVEYDEPEFDAYLGLPGFHRVSGPVKATKRTTILPRDIFDQHDRSFWDMPGQNPRGVTIL
jgi:sulfotransferase